MSAALPPQNPSTQESTPPSIQWLREGDQVVMELAGDWRQDGPAAEVKGEPSEQAPARYQTDKLGTFDSTLPAFILAQLRQAGSASQEKSKEKGEEKGAESGPMLDGMPPNLRGLMELALAVPEESEARSKAPENNKIAQLGQISLNIWSSVESVAEFTGQSMIALGRFFRGRARFRSGDFWLIVQECGVQALPIVLLISFLIGMILAFVGNVQLANFGASLYVADLVGIAMVREMGVVMTAIIMSGRTGAAFAAHIGSMKANEEIDALRTFGFDPFDFLVLPRLLALILMMPILTLFADAIGILGGMIVGSGVGITPLLYWHETVASVTLTTISLGLMKSFFFGAIIAACGCLQGMHAGKSSAAVGEATTRAVVASITAIIILDSAFAAIFTVLNI
jgi:phospholipid/cholesterol/gamma-HCH transport system permease protein